AGRGGSRSARWSGRGGTLANLWRPFSPRGPGVGYNGSRLEGILRQPDEPFGPAMRQNRVTGCRPATHNLLFRFSPPATPGTAAGWFPTRKPVGRDHGASPRRFRTVTRTLQGTPTFPAAERSAGDWTGYESDDSSRPDSPRRPGRPGGRRPCARGGGGAGRRRGNGGSGRRPVRRPGRDG